MAFLKEKELYNLYTESKDEADQWRKDYKEYERLADNDLMDDLDESLPEVNDGSLAASLFKLPKRIISSSLKGRASTLNSDDAWVTELANIQWEENIIPNANSQAPFHRKWKDAVRKAAIYGGQPIINLFVERGDYTGSDFIVPQAQDVVLEAGKVSDYDSDVIFWDVYYSRSQVETMLEQAKEEKSTKEGDPGYNKWDTKALEDILKSKLEDDQREQNNEHNKRDGQAVKKAGIHFCIAFQRGLKAPFYMYHKSTKKTVREWENPDPTGDIPVHYIYCYQDFINPYGIGIVKLAGGTQNSLDYFRQADILTTQLGMRPPKMISGNDDEVDYDSLVYAQDADWIIGPNAKVERMEMSSAIYQALPERISMYKTSLNQLIPVGDTSISSGSGDPNYSKTPAGVKFQQASLSIDDEDFKDNFYMTYEAVAKSMINTHFANMQGTDLMKLSDEQRDILSKTGLEFPVDEEGNPTNELEVIWDEARATFKFKVDAEEDKAKDDDKKLEGLLKVAEFRAADPMFDQKLAASGKRLNDGELFSSIIRLTSDNDKIIEDVDPEDLENQGIDPMTGQPIVDPRTGQPMQPEMQEGMPPPEPIVEQPPEDPEVAQAGAEIQAVMEQYQVDENTAAAMLEAERLGFEKEEILATVERQMQQEVA